MNLIETLQNTYWVTQRNKHHLLLHTQFTEYRVSLVITKSVDLSFLIYLHVLWSQETRKVIFGILPIHLRCHCCLYVTTIVATNLKKITLNLLQEAIVCSYRSLLKFRKKVAILSSFLFISRVFNLTH